ncbi:MAG: regulatory protein RecX [Schleiferiaceae bacterium]|nr:regulatory protein RecX [Schleiferiaceae bacterium]
MAPFKREKIYDLEVARSQVRKYCAYQDRCQFEVEQRLRDMGLQNEAAETLLIELIEEGFLSEERFARAYVRGKHRAKGWGRIKIIQGLKAKRVPESCIRLGLQELDEQGYQNTLVGLLEKTWPWTGRAEVYAASLSAQRKGYTWNEIQEAIQFLETEAE